MSLKKYGDNYYLAPIKELEQLKELFSQTLLFADQSEKHYRDVLKENGIDIEPSPYLKNVLRIKGNSKGVLKKLSKEG